MKPLKLSHDSLVDELLDARLSKQARRSLWSFVLVDALREQERPKSGRKHRRIADDWVVLRPAGSGKPAA